MRFPFEDEDGENIEAEFGLCIGDRVVRGPDWAFGDEDGNSFGVIKQVWGKFVPKINSRFEWNFDPPDNYHFSFLDQLFSMEFGQLFGLIKKNVPLFFWIAFEAILSFP